MDAPSQLFATLLLLSAPGDTTIVPLEEVVVTGSRVPEPLQRTPAAVSVVDKSAFRDTRGISLKDALGTVPGVWVQSRAGGQDVRVTIRGFGARGNGERSNVGNMRGIRVMTDGVPLTEPDGRTALDLADFSLAGRLEVSRSNSSTLYGNASGGVIHLRTDFQFEKPWLEYRERLGGFGYHREQVSAGFPLGRGRAVVGLHNSTLEGWREHSSTTASLLQARFQTPLAHGTRLGVLLDATHTLNRFPGALTAAQLASNPERADPDFVVRDERRDHRVGRLALSVNAAPDPAQEASFSMYVEPKDLARSERDRYREFDRYHVGASATYLRRGRLGPSLESVTLLGGDESYQDGDIRFFTLVPGGSRGDTLKADKREAANGAGFFLQQELIWRGWSLRLAARYDHLRYLSEDRLNPALDATRNFSRWTPKGSLSRAFDRHMLYAALGGGVEAPAFNEIDPPPPFRDSTSFNPFLEAMRSTTWEVGARGSLLNGPAPASLLYDVALYWIDIRDELVPWGGGAYFFTAGRSRRCGAELGLSWRPRQSLRLQGTATVSENTYLEYTNDLGDFSGRRVPGLPRVSLAGNARYDARGGMWAELSMESQGEYFADDANIARVAAHTLVGVSAGAERRLGAVAVRAFVAGHNLTDEAHLGSVFINGTNGEFFEPGLPRSWSAGLSLRLP